MSILLEDVWFPKVGTKIFGTQIPADQRGQKSAKIRDHLRAKHLVAGYVKQVKYFCEMQRLLEPGEPESVSVLLVESESLSRPFSQVADSLESELSAI